MTLLTRIVDATRERVEELRSSDLVEQLRTSAEGQLAPRGFESALSGDDVAVIAEIKRQSPLKGPLAPDLDALTIATEYARGGAAAISVLTEPDFFAGSLDDLAAAGPVGVPLLRKDFVVDQLQVIESRAFGADAVLLIVRVVGDELPVLFDETRSWGMDALVEVYDDRDVEIALAGGATLIGVNNRDLETFEVDPDRTAKLASRIPEDVTLVALSGVSARRDVEMQAAAGARAVLVGESLVTAEEPATKLRELRGVTG